MKLKIISINSESGRVTVESKIWFLFKRQSEIYLNTQTLQIGDILTLDNKTWRDKYLIKKIVQLFRLFAYLKKIWIAIERKERRTRLFEWYLIRSKYNVGTPLSGISLVIQAILFPIKSIHWRLHDKEGMKYDYHAWLIDGIFISSSLLFTAKPGDKFELIEMDKANWRIAMAKYQLVKIEDKR